jgi:hypothetical protein
LLDYFGYRRNNQNEYVYQSSTSAHETEKRGKGIDEIVKFYDYLKNTKGDSLNDLERFIQVKLFIKKHEHFYFLLFFFFIQNFDRSPSADSNRECEYFFKKIVKSKMIMSFLANNEPATVRLNPRPNVSILFEFT